MVQFSASHALFIFCNYDKDPEFTEDPLTAGFEFDEAKDAYTYNPETVVNEAQEPLQASAVEIDLPAVDMPNSEIGAKAQASFATNAASGSSPEEVTKSFTVSQNSINEQTDGTVDTCQFIVTSNEHSLEEIPAMGEQDTDMQDEQSIEAMDIGQVEMTQQLSKTFTNR